MKASELRIGNFVELNGVTHTVNGATIIYQKSTHNCNPIHITEEWLLKLGFSTITENSDETKNYWNKGADCSIDVETYLLSHKIEVGFKYRVHERIRTKQILFVHQLQNIYFALTGTELEIK